MAKKKKKEETDYSQSAFGKLNTSTEQNRQNEAAAYQEYRDSYSNSAMGNLNATVRNDTATTTTSRNPILQAAHETASRQWRRADANNFRGRPVSVSRESVARAGMADIGLRQKSQTERDAALKRLQENYSRAYQMERENNPYENIGWLQNETDDKQYSTAEMVQSRLDFYEQNKGRIADLTDKLNDYHPYYDVQGQNTGLYVQRSTGRLVGPQEFNRLRSQLEGIQAENRMFERTQAKMDRYAEYSLAPDFEQVSANRNLGNPTREELRNYDEASAKLKQNLTGQTVAFDAERNEYVTTSGKRYAAVNPLDVPDKLGMFLETNNDAGKQERLDTYYEIAGTGSNVESTWAKIVQEGETKFWNELKPNEINTYYYLYNTQGQEAAYEYLDDLEYELGRRNQESMSEEYNASSLAAKIFYNALTVPANVFGGPISAASDIVNTVQGKDINPYNIQHGLTNFAQVVRSNTAKAIDEKFGGANLFGISMGDVYQAVMSGMDSLLGAKTFGHGYTMLMGAGAASSKAADLYAKGASNEQIAVGALLSGTAEAAFEYISLDKFLNTKSTKNMGELVRQVLSQGGVEASEEVATEIANTFIDVLNMRTQSEWMKDYNEGGFQQAFMNLLSNVIDAGAGGFISGGAMAGGGSAMNLASYNRAMQRLGAESYGNGQAAFAIDYAKNNETSEAVQTALERAQDESAKPEARVRDMGKLIEAVNEGINETQTKAAIKETLEESGRNASDAVVNAVYDQMTSNADIVTGRGTEGVSDVDLEGVEERAAEKIQSERSRAVGEYAGRVIRAENTQARQEAIKDKISEEGQTTLKVGEEETEPVEIKNVKSIDKDGMTLELQDGRTVNSNDISYGTETEAVLYESAKDLGLSASVANQLIKSYDPAFGNAVQYMYGMNEAINYGKLGVNQDIIRATGFYADLTPAQRTMGITIGQNLAEADRQAETQKLLKATMRTIAKTNAHIHNLTGESIADMAEIQKESIGVMARTIQNVTHNDVYLFATVLGEDGKRHLAETIKDEDGYRKGDECNLNGFYDSSTGNIYIDINAGLNGEGAMLWTFAHELTHWAKDLNRGMYDDLVKFLADSYMEKGHDILALARQKAIDLKYDLSDPESMNKAMDEVIADSMERMFTDTNLEAKLYQLSQQNRTLFEKLRDAILSIYNRIKALYSKVDIQTREGQLVHDMGDKLEAISDLFAKVLAGAGETNAVYDIHEGAYPVTRTEMINGQEVTLDANTSTEGMRVEMMTDGAVTPDGQKLFQYRAMENDMPQYRQLLLANGTTAEECDRLFGMIDRVMEKIKDNLEVLDYAWDTDIDDRSFNPVKANSDHLYVKSVDFSTLCRKRLLQQVVQIQLQTALDRALTREEGIAIRNELMKIQQEGREIEVACALCYVESARMKSPAQIQKFLDNRETVLRDYFAEKDKANTKQKKADAELQERQKLSKEYADDIAAGKMRDPMAYTTTAKGKKTYTPLRQLPKKLADQIRDAKKSVNATYQYTADEQRMIDALDTLTVSDFTTPDGLAALVKNYPRIYDAYVSYVRNATQSKGIEGDIWWRFGDSYAISDSLIDAMNTENGLRSQSWSDFQVIHTLDYIAAIIELSARKAKMQVYSKVPDYIKLMGNTGQMINMSLIPMQAYNGMLEYDSVEGMPIEKALALRNKYANTAGTICIGINDDQIRQLLDSADIDYVIPYHHSGMSKVVRHAMNIPGWTTYQEVQNPKKLTGTAARDNAKKYGVSLLSESDKRWHTEPTFSEWIIPDEIKSIADNYNSLADKDLTPEQRIAKKKYGVMFGSYVAMQQAAEKFKKMCAERGLAPQFSYGKGDFSNEENYWKLLIDRKMINNVTGEFIVQQAVKPVFIESDIMEILNDELARYPGVKADQEYATRSVVEKFLSGKMNDEINAIQKVTGVAQTAIDDVTKISILASERGDVVDTETSDGEDTRFSLRTDPAPTKTQTAYKLMRLVDGHLYPLFIGNNERIDIGTWYDADSPNISMLRDLAPGTHLINMETGEAVTFEQYADEHIPKKNGKPIRSKPNVSDIHWANDNGYRFMLIEDKAGSSSENTMRKKYGDTRAYYNWGVNGSAKTESGEGSASIYALRPGWHFGAVPSMRQIGYGAKGDEFRLDNQVWVEVEMSADIDYQAEANANVTGDIPTHIPTNGYYTYATNPTQKKSKNGNTAEDRTKADWYVAGAFRPVRIMSDVEADEIVNRYNAETGSNIPLDYRRSGGRVFNADTMQVEEPTDTKIKFSQRDSSGRQLSPAQQEFFKDSKVRDENGNLLAVYHGTDAEFTVFDRTKGRSTMDIQGSFFSPWDIDAAGYGSNVQAYYLNITNPASEALGYKALNKFKGQNNAGVKAREYLESLGYDGVNNSDEEYIAFYPEQIKRIDNLNPTSNPDIRYSERKEYKDDLAEWDATGRPDSEILILGTTGDVIQGLGAIESDVYIKGEKINKIFHDHPEMDISDIAALPDILEKPILILKSKNTRNVSVNSRIIVFGKEKATNGLPVMVVFDVMPDTPRVNLEDMQKVNSAYTKTTHPINFVASSDVLYVMQNEKKATSLLQAIGFQMPITWNKNGYMGSITYGNRNVNIQGEPFANVIQNNGTFYSERNPEAVETLREANRTLQRQVETLKGDVKHLVALLAAQKNAKAGNLSMNSIQKLADQLITENNATAGKNKVELVQLLTNTYERIRNSRNISSEDIAEYSQPVVDWIMNHQKKNNALSEEAQALFSYLKGKRLYVSPEMKSEIEGYYGNYNDFRNSLMGRLTLTTTDPNATRLDGLWGELNGQFPWLFDAETPEGDQFQKLYEVIQDMKDSGSSQYLSYFGDNIRQDIIQQVYNGYWNASTLREADKQYNQYQRQINELKYKHNQEIAKLKSYYKGKMEDLQTKLKQEMQVSMTTYRQRVANREKQLKQDFRDRQKAQRMNRESSDLRTKIRKISNDFMTKLNHPTEKKYIPAQLAQTVIDIATAIDTSGFRQDTMAAMKYRTGIEALTQLRAMYEELKDDNQYDYNWTSEYEPEFAQRLGILAKAVGDTPLREMSHDQLSDVYDVMHDLQHMISVATKQIIDTGQTGENITNDAAGEEVMMEMEEVRKLGLNKNKLSAFFRNYMTNPLRAVNEMTGYNPNSRLGKLITAINDGIKKGDKWRMDTLREIETMRQEDPKAFNNATERAFDFGLKDIDGKDLKISKMQAMQLVMTWAREQSNEARMHLQAKGTRIADVDLLRKGRLQDAIDYGQKIGPVNQEMIDQITSKLSDWDKRFMAAVRKVFDAATVAINQTTLTLKGRIIATEKDYIPYEVDKDFVATELENVKYNATIENSGMLKSVKKYAPQALLIRGLNAIVDKHVNDVAKVYGLMIPVRNFNKVWNNVRKDDKGKKTDQSVKSAVRDTWQHGGLNIIENAVSDVQGPRPGQHSKIVQKIKSGFVTSTLASNISVWMKQAASYPTAGSILSNDSLMKGLGRYIRRKSKDVWAEIDKYTAQHWKRRQGLSTQELGEFSQTTGWQNRINSKLGKLSPMQWIQAMDVATTAALWEASKAEIEKRGGYKKGSEEYFQAVAKLYDEVIEKTQPMYDPLHRAEITKNQALGTIIMFQTQPIQNSGILREATMEYKYAKKKYGAQSEQAKAAARGFRKAVLSQAASHLTFTAMTILAGALMHKMNPYRRDDTGEITLESVLKQFAIMFGENYLNAVLPVIGNYAVSAAEKISGQSRYDVFSDAVVDKLNTTMDALNKLVTKPDMDTAINAITDVAGYFGVPAKNAYNIVQGAKLHIMDAIKGELGSFNAGYEVKAKQLGYRIYNALEEGDTATADLNIARFSEEHPDSKWTSYVKTIISDLYKKGKLTQDEAEKKLVDYLELDEWDLRKWRYQMANGNTKDYGKYNAFFTAVETGENLQFIINDYLDNGVEKKTLASQITSNYKPQYINASASERKAMKEYLLEAYSKLGYDKSDKSKDIDKWLEDKDKK